MTALVTASAPHPTALPTVVEPAGFDFGEFQVFDSIPMHRDFGIAALAGLVAVYDLTPLFREGIIEGALYVRESQHTVACRDWESWLEEEWQNRKRRCSPHSPLQTRREVVKAIKWPRADRETDNWAVRLASGFTDGPYYDWAFGKDFVGKVVGIYRPKMN